MTQSSGWTAKSRGNALGYGIFQFFIKHFGLRFAYANLTYVVLYFFFCSPKAWRALWNYYRRHFHYKPFRTIINIYRHFFCFGQCIVDKMAAKAGLTSELTFSTENYEPFLDVLNGNKGVILVGAHIGAWEMGAQFFGDYGKKMNIVMWDAEWQKIKAVINRNALADNYNVIPVNKDSIEAILHIKKALEDGEYICMQGDRYTNEEHHTAMPFLNGTAEFPDGPFLLAAKMKVPVVFYFSMREKMGYHFIFHIVQVTEKLGSKDYQQAILKQYVETLERLVRRYPRQWFNFYEFWKN